MNNDNIQAYGTLCSLYYDATEKFASHKEVDFFISWIGQHPGKVLEAMSGSGRLQLPLIQAGYDVEGVDHSSAMLERCHQRAKELEVQVQTYQQSLENLLLPHVYGTIIIAFGSIQLISDREILVKVLKNLRSHMAHDGNLLLDIFIPDTTIEKSSVSTVKLDESTSICVKRRHIFDEQNKMVMTFSLFELLVNGVIQKQENELIEIVWRSDEEWKELLFEAGFEIVKIYDQKFKESEKSRIIHAKPVVKV